MYLMIFDEFARMFEDLPANAILKALELDSKMLEYDWENYRLYLPEDAYSIFCFRRFIRSARLGKSAPRCMPLPAKHVKFYRQVVDRLIQAKELPKSALKQFENEVSIAS